MARATFKIEGMTCGHCVAAVEKALAEATGVERARASLGAAEVDFDPARTAPERLAKEIAEAGYRAEVA